MFLIVIDLICDDVQFKALIPRQGNHLIRDFRYDVTRIKEFQPIPKV